MLETVLFDLDGTLLPMDQDVFVASYFRRLAKRVAPCGYEPEALIQGVWKGTAAMVQNDGSRSNEAAFWDCFCGIFGEAARAHMPEFEAFYREDFDGVAADCGFTPRAKRCVEALKARGLKLVLATNPLFPAIATEKRMGWAGLSPSDFLYFTSYENARYCKPNPLYYREILETLNLKAENCLMVGNDVDEDMVAETLGMRVFLLTDCLINKRRKDIAAYPHGGFDELMAHIEGFLEENVCP